MLLSVSPAKNDLFEGLRRSKGKANAEAIITHPPHYIAGRTIEPIEAIEGYGLCHHLACALKYIARCGRKEDGVQDLQKALWYLLRLQEKAFWPLQGRLDSQRPTPEEIAQDWGLSPLLSKALTLLLRAQEREDPVLLILLIQTLKRALKDISHTQKGRTIHDF